MKKDSLVMVKARNKLEKNFIMEIDRWNKINVTVGEAFYPEEAVKNFPGVFEIVEDKTDTPDIPKTDSPKDKIDEEKATDSSDSENKISDVFDSEKEKKEVDTKKPAKKATKKAAKKTEK